ncbi:MAG: sulfatase-like hydrolase/transferase [Thermoguttaceae bacterium]|nr:sulfatase-like hydrolase/transferase [Thermoguttaceae bacterium]
MKTPVFFLLTMLSVSLLFAHQEPNYQDGPELESIDEVEQTPAPEPNPENDVQKPVLEDVQPQDDNVEETDSQLATRNSQLDVPEENEGDIKVVAPPSADNHPAVVPESIVQDDQAPKNDARNSQLAARSSVASADPPNVVLIVADELGLGDVGCYFGAQNAAPRICQLANEGLRFTDFSASAPDSLSAQRAIVTGRRFGKNIESTGLGAIAKKHSYRTAFFGQWLLGTDSAALPTDCGFDVFWGTTAPADKWSFHPVAGELNAPLKVWDNSVVVGYNLNPETYNRQISARAAKFIKKAPNDPFFVCVFFPSFRPLTSQEPDAYKNAVENLDKAVGEIVDAVDAAGVTNKTLVVFLSSCGPNRVWGAQAGSTGPYRADVGFEGTIRVPCIVRYSEKVQPGVYNSFANQLDVLPTVAQLWNVTEEELGKREGKSLVSVLDGKTEPVYKSFAYFSADGSVIAVRADKWKLYCPQEYKSVSQTETPTPGVPAPYVIKNIDWELYDLSEDPGETTPKNDERPDIVETIRKAINR